MEEDSNIAGEWRKDEDLAGEGKEDTLTQSQRWSQNVKDTEEKEEVVSREEGWGEGGVGERCELSQSPRAPSVSL